MFWKKPGSHSYIKCLSGIHLNIFWHYSNNQPTDHHSNDCKKHKVGSRKKLMERGEKNMLRFIVLFGGHYFQLRVRVCLCVLLPPIHIKTRKKIHKNHQNVYWEIYTYCMYDIPYINYDKIFIIISLSTHKPYHVFLSFFEFIQ